MLKGRNPSQISEAHFHCSYLLQLIVRRIVLNYLVQMHLKLVASCNNWIWIALSILSESFIHFVGYNNSKFLGWAKLSPKIHKMFTLSKLNLFWSALIHNNIWFCFKSSDMSKYCKLDICPKAHWIGYKMLLLITKIFALSMKQDWVMIKMCHK